MREQAGVPCRASFLGHRTGRWHELLGLAAVLCACLGLVACRPTDKSATEEQIAAKQERTPAAPPSTGSEEPPAESSPQQPAGFRPGEPASDGAEVASRADKATADARRAARPLRPGAINDITFDDLELDMPVGTLFNRSMLTPRAAQLDGQKVRIRGFIFAGVFQQSGITAFPFVKNTQCKFGPQGLAFCVMLVDLDEGVTTDFTTYPVTVEGTLTVHPYDSNGFTWSVYHVQAQRVF